MAFNGSGAYSAPSLPGSWNPAQSGSSASPTDWNTLLADIQTALTTVICKDGQTTVTANLPMATFRHTGVGNAVARDDYAAAGQVQDSTLTYVAAGGTSDVITLTLAPAVTAYVVGQMFSFKASAANTTTTPTLNVNGVGAGTIVWPDGSALVAGDIPNGAQIVVKCSATTPVWHLQTVPYSVNTTKLAGSTLSVMPFFTPQGRLTLTSGSPVMTANATAATSIYYSPYNGNLVPLYDGTNLVPTTFAELTNTTTDNTKNPAAVTTNSNYDLFVWNDSGTIRLGRGPAWTSDTARGTGAGTTELQRVNGVWLNKVAITNGPVANRGTYVGTVRSDGSSQINWQAGAIAANGTEAILGVWNYYNRVQVGGLVGDSTDTWTCATTTIRPANNSNTMRASWVCGLAEDPFEARYDFVWAGPVAGTFAYAGVGLDSTTVFAGRRSIVQAAQVTAQVGSGDHRTTSLGFHYMQALECGDGSNGTFEGDNGVPLLLQTGMSYSGRF